MKCTEKERRRQQSNQRMNDENNVDREPGRARLAFPATRRTEEVSHSLLRVTVACATSVFDLLSLSWLISFRVVTFGSLAGNATWQYSQRIVPLDLHEQQQAGAKDKAERKEKKKGTNYDERRARKGEPIQVRGYHYQSEAQQKRK